MSVTLLNSIGALSSTPSVSHDSRHEHDRPNQTASIQRPSRTESTALVVYQDRSIVPYGSPVARSLGKLDRLCHYMMSEVVSFLDPLSEDPLHFLSASRSIKTRTIQDEMNSIERTLLRTHHKVFIDKAMDNKVKRALNMYYTSKLLTEGIHLSGDDRRSYLTTVIRDSHKTHCPYDVFATLDDQLTHLDGSQHSTAFNDDVMLHFVTQCVMQDPKSTMDSNHVLDRVWSDDVKDTILGHYVDNALKKENRKGASAMALQIQNKDLRQDNLVRVFVDVVAKDSGYILETQLQRITDSQERDAVCVRLIQQHDSKALDVQKVFALIDNMADTELRATLVEREIDRVLSMDKEESRIYLYDVAEHLGLISDVSVRSSKTISVVAELVSEQNMLYWSQASGLLRYISMPNDRDTAAMSILNALEKEPHSSHRTELVCLENISDTQKRDDALAVFARSVYQGGRIGCEGFAEELIAEIQNPEKQAAAREWLVRGEIEAHLSFMIKLVGYRN